MKVLKGTSAWINGKLYPEGSPIPKESEKEFSDYLIEIPDGLPSLPKDPADRDKEPSNIHSDSLRNIEARDRPIKVILDSEKSDSLNKGNSKKNK